MLTAEKALNLFEVELKRLNYSAQSLNSYFYGIRKFFSLKQFEDVRDVKKSDIESYVDYLYNYRKRKGESLKSLTIQSCLKGLRQLFNFLLREEYILLSPCDGVEAGSYVRKIRSTILSENEMQRFLESIETGKAHGLRDRVLFELLYATGIRRAELLNLKVGDVNQDEGLVFVKGKGNKERVVPLGNNMLALLKEYLQRARGQYVVDYRVQHLFLNYQGQRLGAGALAKLLAKYLNKAELKKKVCLHSIRHSFATHMLKQGAEIRYIQAILGHESIHTTQIYLNLTAPGLRKLYEENHPLENELYFDVRERERYILETPLKRRGWGWKKWKKKDREEKKLD